MLRNLRNLTVLGPTLLLIGSLVAAVVAAAPPDGKPAPQRRPPHPALASVEDQSGLPGVKLIGDSISIGYTFSTRQLLTGKLRVSQIEEVNNR